MLIQLFDVKEHEYITEFEVNGDLTDAIMVANELTHYIHESSEYERVNSSMTLNLDLNIIEIQVKEVG